MPIDSEEFEAEQDFDYTYNYSFSFGIIGGIFRRVTSHVGTVASESSRTATFNRSATSHTQPVGAFSGGRVVFIRSVGSHVGPTQSASQRVATYNRDPSAHVQTVTTTADRALLLPRSATSHVRSLVANIDRLEAVLRTTTAWVNPVVTDLAGRPIGWRLDGDEIRTVTAETATHSTLSLVIRSESQQLTEQLRDLKSDEGQVDTLDTDDGGYVAVDRANGANTFTLQPRSGRRPLRQSGAYHVERYEEELVSQSVEEWDVEIDFVPAENRDDTRSIDETPAADEWGFSTRYGEIATDRVDAEFAGRGEGGVRRFDLTARLTFEQTLSFESALSRLGGVRVREIPDATNQAVDETDDDAATVTVDSPTEETVASGEYAVVEWESERLNDAYQSVSFTLAEL